MSRTVELVTVQADDLRRMLREIIDEALGDRARTIQAGGQVISANQAARLAKRRRCVVAEAMRSGALRSKKRGGRLVTTVADVRAWAEVA